MADLRVTDAVMTAAQQGFSKAASRLAQGADAMQRLDADGAGAGVLAEAIRTQDNAVSSGLAGVAAALVALAGDVAAANESYGQTDQNLGDAMRGVR
jgi:hypothetical protein